MSDWINFRELNKQLDFSAVLASYDVSLTQKGAPHQLVGKCPLPQHKGNLSNSFSANVNERLWRCFACKAGGNIVDFAVLMEGKDRSRGHEVRAVALLLRDRFLSRGPESPTPPRPKVQQPRKEPRQVVVNQPLDFALKTLEVEHPSFAARGITAETVARFGLGFCKRGSLTGRIAIPLHDDAEQLVGYSGLIVNESEASEENPKYKFPAEREVDGITHVFDSGKFLYNAPRVTRSTKDLIVVPECHLVWSLWQAGLSNVVSLMAHSCSPEQAAIIPMITSDSSRVWLVTAAGEDGWRCAQSFLPQVASNRLCRWLICEDNSQIAPQHPLFRLLPKR